MSSVLIQHAMINVWKEIIVGLGAIHISDQFSYPNALRFLTYSSLFSLTDK